VGVQVKPERQMERKRKGDSGKMDKSPGKKGKSRKNVHLETLVSMGLDAVRHATIYVYILSLQ
jgi:hypothetical protein